MVKGFGKKAIPPGATHFAIELNREDINETDLENAEPLELLEIHHIYTIPFAGIDGKKAMFCLDEWRRSIMTNGDHNLLTREELLAEFYTHELEERAKKIGANVSRIYYNKYLGDTTIRINKIGHIYSDRDLLPSEKLPNQAIKIMKKYVVLHTIADGKKVTWRNRLGK
jgi:hypothetical protein